MLSTFYFVIFIFFEFLFLKKFYDYFQIQIFGQSIRNEKAIALRINDLIGENKITGQVGDKVIITNLGYEPKNGDIVVVSRNVENTVESQQNSAEPIIKRVIGVGGQTVDIDFVEGIVYVDGKALQEDYTYTPTNMEEGMAFPLTVDENCVFAMGDNRNRSRDSRSPDIGQIDKREILGKAIYLFLPGTDEGHRSPDYERMGAIK